MACSRSERPPRVTAILRRRQWTAVRSSAVFCDQVLAWVLRAVPSSAIIHDCPEHVAGGVSHLAQTRILRLVTLVPGVRLGPYQITRPIGAGGMGEVYCARDTRLQRDVAIKVLS